MPSASLPSATTSSIADPFSRRGGVTGGPRLARFSLPDVLAMF
jgi:hypothetical protein